MDKDCHVLTWMRPRLNPHEHHNPESDDVTRQLDFSSLSDAIRALGDALEILGDKTWLDAQPQKVRNTLVSGAVQSVEFVYELAVKSIRRSLEAYFESPGDVDGMTYRELIRTAAERGLLEDVQAWFGYREMRNITSHTYDERKARDVLVAAPGFLSHAQVLLDRLNAING
jgi:nucleotidyltransferase substrate binding protein (TIGR01987 family)